MRKKLSRSGGKKKKKKRYRKANRIEPQSGSSEPLLPEGGVSWMEKDGMHALLPGEKPSEEMVKQITKNYQREIRKSPLFKEWVAQYGKKRAIEMLRECRFEVR